MIRRVQNSRFCRSSINTFAAPSEISSSNLSSRNVGR